MSDQEGIIRKPQAGNPDEPKFNLCWRYAPVLRASEPHSEGLAWSARVPPKEALTARSPK